MLPQVPQKVVISTVFFDEMPIAVRGEQEHIHFTGGEILQKERVNKALSARVWKENQTARKGGQRTPTRGNRVK